MHRVAITSHSDRALRSPAGRSHVRRWLQQETLTILLQARACVATLRVPAEKGGGAFHQSPSPRSLLLAVGSGRTALWYFYDVREGGACWGGQEVLNRRNAPEDSPAAADGSQRPLGPFEGSVRSPAVFVLARWLSEHGSMQNKIWCMLLDSSVSLVWFWLWLKILLFSYWFGIFSLSM